MLREWGHKHLLRFGWFRSLCLIHKHGVEYTRVQHDQTALVMSRGDRRGSRRNLILQHNPDGLIHVPDIPGVRSYP